MPMDKFPDIAVVGDCSLDLVLYGLSEVLPAERELLAESMAMRIGGSGTITAHNLACLGNEVGFVCTTGGDSFGEFCRTRLARAGVNTSRAVIRESEATGVTVLLQHQASRHMFTYPGVTNSLQLADIDLDFLSHARHFHIASFYLQQGFTRDIPETLRRMKQRGLTISMDPNDDPQDTWDRSILDALQYVDVFMPNGREACKAAGVDDEKAAIAELSRRVPVLVIKRGDRGASVYTNKGTWHVAAHSVRVVDAIGAGDSFDAGFIHGYVRGWNLDRCMRLGAFTGAWSTTASGGTDAFAERASVDRLWETWAACATEVVL